MTPRTPRRPLPAAPGLNDRYRAAIQVYNADYDAAFTALRTGRDALWADYCRGMAELNANFDRDRIAAGARLDAALIPGPQAAA